MLENSRGGEQEALTALMCSEHGADDRGVVRTSLLPLSHPTALNFSPTKLTSVRWVSTAVDEQVSSTAKVLPITQPERTKYCTYQMPQVYAQSQTSGTHEILLLVVLKKLVLEHYRRG